MPLSLRTFVAALIIAASASPVAAKSFECTVADGVYRPLGTTRLEPAAKRDPTILGTSFTVDTRRARVSDGDLFRSEGKAVEVLKDTDDVFEVIWKNQHQDVTTLRLTKHASEWTFAYYATWISLVLTGSCRPG